MIFSSLFNLIYYFILLYNREQQQVQRLSTYMKNKLILHARIHSVYRKNLTLLNKCFTLKVCQILCRYKYSYGKYIF